MVEAYHNALRLTSQLPAFVSVGLDYLVLRTETAVDRSLRPTDYAPALSLTVSYL